MNPLKLIRSRIDLSGLPAVIVLPTDARRMAKKLNVRASQSLLLPMSVLVKRGASIDRYIEVLFRKGDTDEAWVVVAAVNDLALAIASRVTANKREASLKVSPVRSSRRMRREQGHPAGDVRRRHRA